MPWARSERVLSSKSNAHINGTDQQKNGESERLEESIVEEAVALDEALVETKEYKADAAADKRGEDGSVGPSVRSAAIVEAVDERSD